MTRADLVDAVEDAQERRLSAAGRPDEGGDPLGVERDIDVLERAVAAIEKIEVADRDLFLQDEVKGIVLGAAGQDANLIWGAVVDKGREGELWVTVIATGIWIPKTMKEEIPESLPKTIPFTKVKEQEFSRIPAYMRRIQMNNENTIVTKGQVTTVKEDDLEVPTFLRRQMD